MDVRVQTVGTGEWVPKFWFGSELSGWLRLLRQNQYAVDAGYIPWAVLITAQAIGNTALSAVQELVWGQRIRNTKIAFDPLFIVGHWRSGSTWLHELLSLDTRHTYPTTYECVFPGHFLLTEPYIPRLLRRVFPSQRPMDRMAAAWDRPQEDEFALCNLGQPSLYLTFAFPNRPQQHPEYFDLESAPSETRQQWKGVFMNFLQRLTLLRPKRLVLKSPTHTYRIKLLLELFPRARFVHIIRDPYKVIPSTIHTWQTFYRLFGLQRPAFEGLQQQTFHNYLFMFDKLDRTRSLIETGRFYELRYEDLVRDPIGEVSNIYKHLELGDVTPVLPRLQQYTSETAHYQTNRYTVSSALKEAIRQRAGEVIQRYNYSSTRE